MTTTLPFGGFLDIKTELLIRNLSLLVFDHELLCWFENMMSLGTFLLRSCQKSRSQEQGHRGWKPLMEAQPFLLFSSIQARVDVNSAKMGREVWGGQGAERAETLAIC